VIEAERPLIAGALLTAYRGHGPYPVVVLHGEQGSAKSTTARVIRDLIDPNSAPLRAMPKEPRDLMIAATNSWVVALDNLSFIPAWLSDALCRLATGGGFATRALYTDDEEALFDAQRPVILTGIEQMATRGDLLDRSVILTLPPIQEERRRDEETFRAAFEQAQPRILGALLQAVAHALGHVSDVHLPRPPRMADFAKWAVAAERALGFEPGTFIHAYETNRRSAVETELEASPIAAPLLALIGHRPVSTISGAPIRAWEGTCSELLDLLNCGIPEQTRHDKSWPKTPRGVRGALNRLAPALRRGRRIEITFHEEGHDKIKKVRIQQPAQAAQAADEANTKANPPDGGGGGAGGSSGGQQPVQPADDPQETAAESSAAGGAGGAGGSAPASGNDIEEMDI